MKILRFLAGTFALSGVILLCGSLVTLFYSINVALSGRVTDSARDLFHKVPLGIGGSAAAFVFAFVLLVMSEIKVGKDS